MERKNFIKKPEDFICGNCGHRVSGSGYTNHCPRCLYSQHVDNVPGDRSNPCHGLMPPVGVEYQSGEYVITHKCVKCGATKKNKAAPDDDFNKIVEISQKYLV
ncbi:hypothetical protein A2V68_00450 [candidate division Kazan bacterium RBG_13_50_9]|uniref:RNHCP domain-containing protein n=1 Tax=candidate division Kazan bacterium RBG_13_50_9 TaxID=1798535 RepID=A0A1F4NRU7_UNCK3|nr:MAG: hypothetical protein A2V68_00450 [candidate division Kazan bacterium RBG_13_50_9]